MISSVVLLNLQIGHADKKKPAIFIDANIHAREWVTSATAVYIINYVTISISHLENTVPFILFRTKTNFINKTCVTCMHNYQSYTKYFDDMHT